MTNAGLGARLKQEREIRKVSIAQVARETGMNPTTIKRIELGYDCHYATSLILIKWIERF